MLLKSAALLFSLTLVNGILSSEVKLRNSRSSLNFNLTENGIGLSLQLNGETKLSGTVGEGRKLTLGDCNETSCTLDGDDGVTLTVSVAGEGFNLSWVASNVDDQKFQDCFDLEIGSVNWFGGQERWTHDWPIEKMKFSNHAYRCDRFENGAVAERYWLSSKGAYIFVDERVPLFLEQNSVKEGSICYAAKVQAPYARRSRVQLQYILVAQDDASQAHLHAINNILGKPTGRPNDWLIRKPIWTTWANYKANISDEIVIDFAKDIANHGFNGQLEIDDSWETCYGTIIFNDQFKNINSTVQTLKDLGFTVTLWTHPFVNDDCKEATEYGRQHGYFVKSLDGNDTCSWWNGNNAHHIDFTNEDAVKWYVDRLRLIQAKHGIDSFKFDAGENNWAPEIGALTGDPELEPNSLTEAYIRTVAEFGDLIEIRSASRTQDLPIFVRQQDKDSRWGLDNGLHNLITTLLQMNINGYTLVLPDMIGGNGYGTDLPTAEILVRWTQANVFMPSMQFSYLPWEVTSDEFDGLAIVKQFIDLHEKYADEIIAAMEDCIKNGTPVNAPVWWVDPTNPDALKVNDEFLLGEKILAAPVIEKGATSRNVFLPKGTWKDGNNGEIHEGPKTIQNYPAPIEILPWFIKQ